MPIDPRNLQGTKDGLTAARLGELERRADQQMRAARTITAVAAPAAPGTITLFYDAGDTKVEFSTMFGPGTTVVDKTNNRTYYWTGTAWKYTAII